MSQIKSNQKQSDNPVAGEDIGVLFVDSTLPLNAF